METPARRDIHADRGLTRNVTFGFFDQDFTGASFAFNVAQQFDEGAIFTLATTTSSTAQGVKLLYGGSDTIANHIAAGRLTAAQAAAAGYASSDTVTLSLVRVRILNSTLALASYPAPELGEDLDMAYDLLITPSGGDQDKYVYGKFVVRGTV